MNPLYQKELILIHESIIQIALCFHVASVAVHGYVFDTSLIPIDIVGGAGSDLKQCLGALVTTCRNAPAGGPSLV